jgi:hypothetical protein
MEGIDNMKREKSKKRKRKRRRMRRSRRSSYLQPSNCFPPSSLGSEELSEGLESSEGESPPHSPATKATPGCVRPGTPSSGTPKCVEAGAALSGAECVGPGFALVSDVISQPLDHRWNGVLPLPPAKGIGVSHCHAFGGEGGSDAHKHREDDEGSSFSELHAESSVPGLMGNPSLPFQGSGRTPNSMVGIVRPFNTLGGVSESFEVRVCWCMQRLHKWVVVKVYTSLRSYLCIQDYSHSPLEPIRLFFSLRSH